MPRPKVWRVVDGAPQKRCPTCEARKRDPWHPLSAFSYDRRRASRIAVRCLQCNREDLHWYYTERVDRGEPFHNAPRTDERRQQEREWERERMKDPAKLEKRRAKNKDYYARKRANGWRRVDGKWVREGDDA
jgi:hypothetical protein